MDESSYQLEIERRVAEARAAHLPALVLGYPGFQKLPSLDDLPFLAEFTVSFARNLKLDELAKLHNLRYLSLQFVGQIDIQPIAHLEKLETLFISNGKISSFDVLKLLTRIEALDLSYTNFDDLRVIARLRNMRSLNLRGTPVSDLSPISNLTKLESLNISDTKVTSLRPVARLDSLLKGARQTGHQYDTHTYGGILYTNAPLDDPTLLGFVGLRKKERTEHVLRHLQKSLDAEDSANTDWDEIALSSLSGVPTPFEFSFSRGKAIQAIGGSANWPSLPLAGSASDLADRLAASREIANGIVEGLDAGEYQVRREYARELRRYVAKLPTDPGTGNILLADAAARTLRTLFSVEADVLSTGFASSLKTFLEQHIGLRAYYPEIQTFYADVRDGKLNTPLPLDATSKFARTVKEFTPAVFEPAVSIALDETSSADDSPTSKPTESEPSSSEKVLQPPPDPLGEIEPSKARSLAIAATVGKLWKAFMDGEKYNSAIKAWIDAAHKLRPIVQLILEWYWKHSGG